MKKSKKKPQKKLTDHQKIIELYKKSVSLNQNEYTNFLYERIFSLTQAIILLAEHIDRVNANSNAPYSSDLEEKIKKILE